MPLAAASRRIAAPNCSSTRMPAFSAGAPPASADEEAVIDDLLGAGDFGGLGVAERRLQTEQPALEGTAVIERLDVERPIVSPRHQALPFILR